MRTIHLTTRRVAGPTGHAVVGAPTAASGIGGGGSSTAPSAGAALSDTRACARRTDAGARHDVEAARTFLYEIVNLDTSQIDFAVTRDKPCPVHVHRR